MRTLYFPTVVTGEGADSLGAMSVSTLNDGDLAFIAASDDTGFYVFKFDSTATNATSGTDYIRPYDYVSAGVWINQYIRAPFMANSIIDGDFNFWFEATSQTSSGYGSDTMWLNENSGTTKVHSRQAFSVGQSAVPGNPKYYSRTVVTSVAGSGNYCRKTQRIEGVASHAGKIATVSFWFNTDSDRNIAIEFTQNFGTGGSPSAEVTGIGSQLVAVTTGWNKYTVSIDIPSIAGKTLGLNGNDYLAMVAWYDAGSSFDGRTASLGQQSGTFDIARVRLVEGEVDGDSIDNNYGEELFRVRRYYEEGNISGPAAMYAASACVSSIAFFAVEKRATPIISVEYLLHYAFSGTPGELVNTTANYKNFRPIFGWTSGVTKEAGYLQYSYKADARI